MRPAPSRFLDSWITLPLLVLVVAISALLHWKLHPYAFDDAYIHLRIAEHFLDQGTPYFNAGQAVMASSSSAWTLILTALFAGSAPAPGPVGALNCLVLAAGAVLFGALAYELRGAALGRLVCWSFAVPYLAVVHFSSVGLMETPMAVLVLGTALLLHVRGRPEAFAFFALACFLRLELAVFVVLFGAERLWFDRRGVPRRLAWCAAAAAPLIAYQLYYFGALVPNTVRAKSIVFSISSPQALELFLREIVGSFPRFENAFGMIAVTAAFLVLAIVCVRAERNRREPMRIEDRTLYLTGAAGALIALTYLGKKVLVFPWYLPIVMVPLFFAFFVTAAGSRSRIPRVLVILLIVAPSVWILAGSLAAALGQPAQFQYFERNARTRQFLAVGRQLFEDYPEARLMSSEVGALGYGFRGEILDAAGLLSPESLDHHPLPIPEERSAGFIGAIPATLVAAERPELIVGLDVFVEGLAKAPIAREYRRERLPVFVEQDRAATPAAGIWSSRHLNLFLRRDLCGGKFSPPC